MTNLIENLQEILEVENLDLNAKFIDLDEWDSLSVLSILALLDSDYGVNISQKELESFPSIGAFIEHIKR